VQSETEIEALGQKARDLAVFVESVRKETRLGERQEQIYPGSGQASVEA